MSRLPVPKIENATGATAEIGPRSRSPLAMFRTRTRRSAPMVRPRSRRCLPPMPYLSSGNLSKRDQETIKVVISGVAGCDYCVAAHSLLGKLAGLKPEELKNIRSGSPTGDDKRAAPGPDRLLKIWTTILFGLRW